MAKPECQKVLHLVYLTFYIKSCHEIKFTGDKKKVGITLNTMDDNRIQTHISRLEQWTQTRPHSERVNVKTVLGFRYRIDETYALEVVHTRVPEWDAAVIKPGPLVSWQSRIERVAGWGYTGHNFGGFSLVVDSYLKVLTQKWSLSKS